MDTSHGTPNQLHSNTEDHWSLITITNIIKFEVLQELPKYDTGGAGEVSESSWKNGTSRLTYLLHDCHKPSICKTKTPAKHNKAKLNKRKYACIKLLLSSVQ